MARKGRGLGRFLLRYVLTVLAAVVALMFFLPFFWMVSSAFRPAEEIFAFLSPLSPYALIPKTLTLENFAQLFGGRLGRNVFNSVLITVLTVTIGLVICSAAAFALSVLRFPFRSAVFAVVVVSFLIPFDAIAIPLADTFRTLGLQNTYAGLVLPAIGDGLAIFVLRQFFMGIPQEMKEAARVDGAGWWTIFWRIYAPLSKPALIGAGLILFLGQWQAYLWPLLIITEPSMQVAPVALSQFVGQYEFNFGALFAGATVVSLIPAVILLSLQPYFVRSVSSQGLKE
ncbi:MAG: SN-glycerol-3-phosphate transport system permease protein UgpE [uncultured Rubrobacteraceae bacterium]|uniref:SN-glycerol-3-phosphate transport system permease protein UgpE n=1 Tax=uncultured Rubrobacteraceae bacterium TaxID=349277 RepID=A0A6J4QPW8_9ACTN|nr:MAG: SN-glycerol-3-phosphate transport system permease protein UgpE [uncultured Rubrobacteraceae bacterium]